MSDHSGKAFSSGQGWQPWRMGDLHMGEMRPGKPSQGPGSGSSPVAPAVPDLDTLRQQAEAQGREKGYKAGFEKGLSEGQRDGYARGHQEGLEKGLAEGRQQAAAEQQAVLARELAVVAPLIQNLGAACEQLSADVADSLVAIALVIGRQLARDHLDVDPAAVLAVVRELLHHEPSLQGKPRLWLHPQDLAIVQQHLGDELRAAGWQLQPDSQITRGGCRASSTSGELDATWETRWAALCAKVRQRGTAGRSDTGEAVQS